MTKLDAETGLAVEDPPPKTEPSAEQQSGGAMGKKYVYVLGYVTRACDGHWRGTTAGYFSSMERAQVAIARLQHLPGYRDYPQGFRIYERLLDTEYHEPGFFDNLARSSGLPPLAQ
jgi:hypothetical protein